MREIRDLGEGKRIALLWMHEFEEENPATSRRETEKKGILFPLNELFGTAEISLKYYGNGKPYLENISGVIPISHSHDLLVILHDSLSEHTGVDVEQVREKVLKIRHKFLSEREKLFIAEKNVLSHIIAWCVKESVYKIHAEGKLDFIENIWLEEFTESNTEVRAKCVTDTISFSKKFRIEKIGNYVLFYPLN